MFGRTWFSSCNWMFWMWFRSCNWMFWSTWKTGGGRVNPGGIGDSYGCEGHLILTFCFLGSGFYNRRRN